MWGFDELLKEESAHNDYSLIYDKLQDMHARMANILENAGFNKRPTPELDGPVNVTPWFHKTDKGLRVDVHVVNHDNFNLITNVIVKIDDEIKTFHLLSKVHYNNPHTVTGDVATEYIESLEHLESWMKDLLGSCV